MSEAAWAESVWNVFLRLSLISCPVRLVPATAPIDREFEALLSESGGIIDLTHFTRSDPVEGTRVGTRYDIYPNGPVAAETLDALRQAMRRTGRDAAAFAFRGERERMLLIEPYGGGLRLSVMRRPLTTPGTYAEPAERQVPAELVEMAEAAIGRCLHDEDANGLHERYEHRVQALIAAKTGGVAPPPSSPEPNAAVAALVAAVSLAPQSDAAPPEIPRPDIESEAEADAAIAADLLPREIGTEILLRLIDIGDRRFDSPGWAGMPGGGRRIEAISIRPRDELAPDAVEFRVFAREGRATPWVGNGNYAGTSGRELALTGFAARPTPEIGDRFDVVYEGWFADGGAVGPLRNGESCISPVPDDPLEALRVSLIERRSDVLEEPAPEPTQ
jgi:non-homologous end joining protein Ku